MYVDRYGQNDSEVTLLRQKSPFARRYHMRCTRGWDPSEDRRLKPPTLLNDTVAIQKDILQGKFRSIDTPNEDREEIQQELDLASNRWGSGRSNIGVGERKRPLLTSTEWVRIQIRESTGWPTWQSAERANNGNFWNAWVCFRDDRCVQALTSRKGTSNRGNYYRNAREWRKKDGISAS